MKASLARQIAIQRQVVILGGSSGQSFFRDSVLLSPGGFNLHTTAGANEAHTIPMHLYTGVDIGQFELCAWNTQGVSWDVRRAYLARRGAPATITEDIETGWVTLIGSPMSVDDLGSQTDPKLNSLVDIPTDLTGDFVLHTEIGAGGEKRAWGYNGAATGYGDAIAPGNWTQQQAATLPSSGSFDPYTYTGFSASVLPNIAVRCKSLSRSFVQPIIVGNSIAQGYGSWNSFMGKAGLGHPWFLDWEANDLPFIPLQWAWQGSSSEQIRALLTSMLDQIGPAPVFLEAATINNWNEGFGYPDPGAQNLADLALNLDDLATAGCPAWCWTGFGWDILDATKRGQIRTTYNQIQAEHTDGLYGSETSGVMNTTTMLYEAGMTSDGGHPNGTGWPLFAAANLATATARMESVA